MELKIINKKEDPLLSRTKVESEISFEKSTPSKDEVKSKLGKELGKDEKLIVIKGIYTEYGLKKTKNLSYVYENEESLKKIEVEKKGKGEKKESKPEEKAAEKPQEEKKEEKQEQKEAKPGTKQEEQKPKEPKSEEKPKDQVKEKKQ
tara:strand:- start:260 stop:700 length:441 start_codon:yes stop_codon:yes gene_type:complete